MGHEVKQLEQLYNQDALHDELDFGAFQQDPDRADEKQPEKQTKPESLRNFPSQSLLNEDQLGPAIDYQDVSTEVRGVTATQFGQMICCIRHGLSKHSIHDLVTLVKRSSFFNKDEFIEYDQLKNRRDQLLPLLPLYSRELSVSVTNQKTVHDQGHVKKLITFTFHYLSILDILVREVELLRTGSPLRDRWTNHAVVRPVARDLADGKVCRSSPEFTFAFVKIAGVQYRLGDDVEAKLPDGRTQLCKIASIFMHSASPDDSDEAVAVYVQLYKRLDSLKQAGPRKKAIKLAQQNALDNELVLDTKEILLKGMALEFIQRKVVVVEDPDEMQSPRSYVCRYALEGSPQVCLFFCHPMQCGACT